MQVFQDKSFTNTASGKLNQQQSKQHKLIDLSDVDAQLLQPQFPSNKTLKKPLPAPPCHLAKTNPDPLRELELPTRDAPEPWAAGLRSRQGRQKEQPFAVLDTSGLCIKPAYSGKLQTKTNNFLCEPEAPRDQNTIFSAILRKGNRPTVTPTAVLEPKVQKKPGPAENKLKSMINRNLPTISVSAIKEPQRTSKIKSEHSDIGEEINEELDSYANESFEKLSGAYDSAIRESIAGESAIRESIAGESAIRESIAGESNPIKESIRESISGSAGFIKESIRESIRESMGGSSRSLREEIGEQISGSKAKSKEDSIEEVYEQIFEELSGSQSQSHRFKKSQNYKEESLSHSASKSFRMKTSVVKSLKYAEELLKKDLPRVSDPKLGESISKEKNSLKLLQQKIQQLVVPPSAPQKPTSKDFYYQFRVELNKLMTGEHFESKIKKLLSFLAPDTPAPSSNTRITELEDQILKQVVVQVEGLKSGQQRLDQLETMRQEYQDKLKEQLLVQEVKLRAEMNQKLSDKDLELKKMIAELEQRMMSRSFQGRPPARTTEHWETESDYSIDSNNVSWKADLWQLLPEFEKRKLYDKQTAQVTQFLTDIMVNELQEEALDRSLDISFEFPEEYTQIPANVPPTENRPSREENKPKEPEGKHSDFLSDLPKLNVRKPSASPDSSWSSSSSPKEEEVGQERVRRDERVKGEIVQMLAEYKPVFLRRKHEAVRELLKLLHSKDSQAQHYMLSSLSQLTILREREVRKEHLVYVRAYEEELLMSLVGIFNRSLNKRQPALEEEMKKMYDRLVVVCQVAVAEKCSERVALEAEKDMNYNVEVLTKQALQSMEQHPCAIDITAPENYLNLKTSREELSIKNELVKQVVDILSVQFAREFPNKKRSHF